MLFTNTAKPLCGKLISMKCRVREVILTFMFCFHVCTCSLQYESDLSNSERFQKGKEQYDVMQRDSEVPKYGMCWKNAITQLQTGCKRLTDDVQHRLALTFTSCFMEKLGRPGFPCKDKQDISDCTRDMDPQAFNTMTNFFTHTQNICFFLQSQIWQEKTESTVSRLAETSENVVHQLEESTQIQDQLINQQNKSLHNQERMLENSQALSKTIESSTNNVHVLIKEFKDSTDEQRQLLSDVFERVGKLHAIMVGEFTGFYSFIFYTLSIVICYLLTSTPRTSAARVWLFVAMTMDVICERLIISSFAEEGSTEIPFLGPTVTDSNSLLYSRLWLCRKVFLSVGGLILVVCAARFRDYNKINNVLLVEIKKQNSELKHLLNTSQNIRQVQSGVDKHDSYSAIRQSSPAMITQGTGPLITSSSESMDYTDDGESDTETSSDSGSDYTFVGDEDYSDDDDASSVLTESSFNSFREGTPMLELLEEVQDLRESTPVREMTPLRQNSGNGTPSASPSHRTPRGRGRPRGSRSSTPLVNDRPGMSYYNLRQRHPVISPNPVLATETEKDFKRMVKHLRGVVRKNADKTRFTIHKTTPGLLLSDEEL